jgi:hypothetical protein
MTTTKAPRQTLLDRCRDWIHTNVPVHSRAEYEALLITNQDLAVRLIAKCIDFENLLKAHYALQDEVSRDAPRIPWMVSAERGVEAFRHETVLSLRFQMDPYQMNVAVRDIERLGRQWSTTPYVQAFKSNFDRNVVPAIWDAAERAIYRAVGEDRRPKAV